MTKLDEVDVCIIGSGAGGGLAAKELGENGICVVVLEAGKRFNPLHDFCGATQRDWERALEDQRQIFRVPKMDRVTIASKDTHRPSVAYGVGGTTLRYLAYCPRLLPDDFSIRSHDGVGMDWPITYEELAPYYRKVEWELGVSGAGADPWFPDIEKYPNPPFEFSYTNKIVKRGCDKLGIRLWPVPVARNSRPFDGRPTCVQCGECEYGCMTGARSSVDVTYIPKAEATGKVQIRPECVVTRIETDANGKAKSVVYFDKNGMEYEQKAKIIIVSAGTVQTPRLLLNSKSSQHPDGLANSSGMVGRNWMQHISLFSAAVFPDRIDSYRGFFGGAISLDRAGTNKKNSFARGWSLELNSGIRGPAQLALSVPGWGTSHKKYLHRVFGHIAGIVTVGEQLPDERNRVELDPEVVDHYGMPVPRITFNLYDNDKLMLKAMEKNLREIYTAAGATEILKMRYRKGGGGHNMGTCRMGKSPKTSVCNSFCQCHDVPNLFLVDGSVFVSGGTANPALTIQALGTRAVRYLIEEGKKGNL